MAENYRDPGSFDQDVFRNHLQEKGYQVESLEQLWRHVTGRAVRDGRQYFFKAATSESIGKLTAVEPAWYRQVSDRLTPDVPFIVPEVAQEGTVEMPDGTGRYFYVCDFIEGAQLATKYPPNVRNLGDWIERIAKSVVFLQGLHGITVKGKPADPAPGRADGYQKKFREWAEESGLDLSDLLAIAAELRQTYEPAHNHGDFVPWHMLEADKRFVLIDAEHASVTKPKYYDIAYFYHRVYTAAKSPALAKAFLRAANNELPKREQAAFMKKFRPVLAGRTIGGFWDLKQGDRTDISFHDALRRDVLRDDIL